MREEFIGTSVEKTFEPTTDDIAGCDDSFQDEDQNDALDERIQSRETFRMNHELDNQISLEENMVIEVSKKKNIYK